MKSMHDIDAGINAGMNARNQFTNLMHHVDGVLCNGVEGGY
jgi:hypothetical protein